MIQKTGLVLEGGAMRGMFTAGVLDVMMENDIKLDGAMGVSAGAVFGCNYKSAHQDGRSVRRTVLLRRDPQQTGSLRCGGIQEEPNSFLCGLHER